jgi:hypothetical protein
MGADTAPGRFQLVRSAYLSLTVDPQEAKRIFPCCQMALTSPSHMECRRSSDERERSSRESYSRIPVLKSDGAGEETRRRSEWAQFTF